MPRLEADQAFGNTAMKAGLGFTPYCLLVFDEAAASSPRSSSRKIQGNSIAPK